MTRSKRTRTFLTGMKQAEAREIRKFEWSGGGLGARSGDVAKGIRPNITELIGVGCCADSKGVEDQDYRPRLSSVFRHN